MDSLARSQAIVDARNRVGDAAVAVARSGNGQRFTLRVLDLGTARIASQAQTIGEFQSVAVLSASHPDSYCYLRVDSDEQSNDAAQVKDPFSLELPYPASKGFLHWPAQTGKTITLLFLRYGVFRTNRTNLSVSGGINSSAGVTATLTQVALSNVAAAIITASTARNGIGFRNTLGEPIYLGVDATVTDPSGINPGFPVMPGEPYEWDSKYSLYGITTGGGGSIPVFTHSP